VEEVAPQFLARVGSAENAPKRTLPQHLGDEFQKVFALFQEQSLQIDEVIESSRCSPSRVSEILLELELLGYIKQLPGKKYRVEG
jgi:predicted Rossmann fold nucleotide-binding protein DprA/Smf involved in DNA uptake